MLTTDPSPTPQSQKGRPPSEELILPRKVPSASILYFNDAHEIAPVNGRGGVARLKTVVDQFRAERSNGFVVFGGDLAGGTLFGGAYKGEPMVEALDEIGIDLANFGSHDFDFKPEHTKRLVAQSQFPWMTSNLTESDGKPFAGTPKMYMRELGGLKIGFVSVTDAVATTTNEGEVKETDPLSSAKKAATELKRKGADVVIAIAQTSSDVLKKLVGVNEIDAILAEEVAEERPGITIVNGKPVLAPCGNLGCVIQLDITKKKDEPPIFDTIVRPLDEHTPKDPAMKEFENKWMEKLNTKYQVPVAKALEALPWDGVYTRETALGNLVADAFQAQYNADIGFIQGGGLRAPLAKGDVSIKSLFSVLPFGNKVVLVQMTGKEIRDYLEHGVAGIKENRGLLQVSGLQYSVDRTKPDGTQVTSIKVNGKELSNDALFKVALPSFLIKGGDKFPIIEGSKIIVGESEAPEDKLVLTEYCKKLSVIEPKLEKRIVIDN